MLSLKLYLQRKPLVLPGLWFHRLWTLLRKTRIFTQLSVSALVFTGDIKLKNLELLRRQLCAQNDTRSEDIAQRLINWSTAGTTKPKSS